MLLRRRDCGPVRSRMRGGTGGSGGAQVQAQWPRQLQGRPPAENSAAGPAVPPRHACHVPARAKQASAPTLTVDPSSDSTNGSSSVVWMSEPSRRKRGCGSTSMGNVTTSLADARRPGPPRSTWGEEGAVRVG